MPRKGENIYKRKDGRWEGRYIKGHDPSGRARYGYVYGKSYREVKEKRGQLGNQQTVMEKQSQIPVQIDQLLMEWLVLHKDKNKPSTYVKYYNLIHRHIIPELGSLPVTRLTTGILQQFTREKLEQGRLDHSGGLSEKTVRDILCIVRAAVSFACKEYPSMAPTLQVIYPREPVREIRVLSREEQKTLESFLLANPDLSKLGIYFCLYTGLRLGEICALRWEDILFSDGVVQVRRTIQRIQDIDGKEKGKTKVIISQPKSRSSFREIPLPEFLIQRVTPFRPSIGTGYFLTAQEDQFMEPRTYQNRFRSYLQQCGIKGANFHALRHTFATRCVEADFEMKSLSEILGHANVNITLSRYVHSSRSLKRANMNKLIRYN